MLNSNIIVKSVSSLILAGLAVWTANEIHSIRRESERMNLRLNLLYEEVCNSNYQINRLHHKLDLIDSELIGIEAHMKS